MYGIAKGHFERLKRPVKGRAQGSVARIGLQGASTILTSEAQVGVKSFTRHRIAKTLHGVLVVWVGPVGDRCLIVCYHFGRTLLAGRSMEAAWSRPHKAGGPYSGPPVWPFWWFLVSP